MSAARLSSPKGTSLHHIGPDDAHNLVLLSPSRIVASPTSGKLRASEQAVGLFGQWPDPTGRGHASNHEAKGQSGPPGKGRERSEKYGTTSIARATGTAFGNHWHLDSNPASTVPTPTVTHEAAAKAAGLDSGPAAAHGGAGSHPDADVDKLLVASRPSRRESIELIRHSIEDLDALEKALDREEATKDKLYDYPFDRYRAQLMRARRRSSDSADTPKPTNARRSLSSRVDVLGQAHDHDHDEDEDDSSTDATSAHSKRSRGSQRSTSSKRLAHSGARMRTPRSTSQQPGHGLLSPDLLGAVTTLFSTVAPEERKAHVAEFVEFMGGTLDDLNTTADAVDVGHVPLVTNTEAPDLARQKSLERVLPYKIENARAFRKRISQLSTDEDLGARPLTSLPLLPHSISHGSINELGLPTLNEYLEAGSATPSVASPAQSPPPAVPPGYVPRTPSRLMDASEEDTDDAGQQPSVRRELTRRLSSPVMPKGLTIVPSPFPRDVEPPAHIWQDLRRLGIHGHGDTFCEFPANNFVRPPTPSPPCTPHTPGGGRSERITMAGALSDDEVKELEEKSNGKRGRPARARQVLVKGGGARRKAGRATGKKKTRKGKASRRPKGKTSKPGRTKKKKGTKKSSAPRRKLERQLRSAVQRTKVVNGSKTRKSKTTKGSRRRGKKQRTRSQTSADDIMVAIRGQECQQHSATPTRTRRRSNSVGGLPRAVTFSTSRGMSTSGTSPQVAAARRAFTTADYSTMGPPLPPLGVPSDDGSEGQDGTWVTIDSEDEAAVEVEQTPAQGTALDKIDVMEAKYGGPTTSTTAMTSAERRALYHQQRKHAKMKSALARAAASVISGNWLLKVRKAQGSGRLEQLVNGQVDSGVYRSDTLHLSSSSVARMPSFTGQTSPPSLTRPRSNSDPHLTIQPALRILVGPNEYRPPGAKTNNTNNNNNSNSNSNRGAVGKGGREAIASRSAIDALGRHARKDSDVGRRMTQRRQAGSSDTKPSGLLRTPHDAVDILTGLKRTASKQGSKPFVAPLHKPVNETIRSGDLERKTNSFFRKWKTRVVKLNPHGLSQYRRQAAEVGTDATLEAEDYLRLEEVQHVFLHQKKSKRRMFEIITTGGEVCVFRAPTHDSAREWATALSGAVMRLQPSSDEPYTDLASSTSPARRSSVLSMARSSTFSKRSHQSMDSGAMSKVHSRGSPELVSPVESVPVSPTGRSIRSRSAFIRIDAPAVLRDSGDSNVDSALRTTSVLQEHFVWFLKAERMASLAPTAFQHVGLQLVRADLNIILYLVECLLTPHEAQPRALMRLQGEELKAIVHESAVDYQLHYMRQRVLHWIWSDACWTGLLASVQATPALVGHVLCLWYLKLLLDSVDLSTPSMALLRAHCSQHKPNGVALAPPMPTSLQGLARVVGGVSSAAQTKKGKGTKKKRKGSLLRAGRSSIKSSKSKKKDKGKAPRRQLSSTGTRLWAEVGPVNGSGQGGKASTAKKKRGKGSLKRADSAASIDDRKVRESILSLAGNGALHTCGQLPWLADTVLFLQDTETLVPGSRRPSLASVSSVDSLGSNPKQSNGSGTWTADTLPLSLRKARSTDAGRDISILTGAVQSRRQSSGKTTVRRRHKGRSAQSVGGSSLLEQAFQGVKHMRKSHDIEKRGKTPGLDHWWKNTGQGHMQGSERASSGLNVLQRLFSKENVLEDEKSDRGADRASRYSRAQSPTAKQALELLLACERCGDVGMQYAEMVLNCHYSCEWDEVRRALVYMMIHDASAWTQPFSSTFPVFGQRVHHPALWAAVCGVARRVPVQARGQGVEDIASLLINSAANRDSLLLQDGWEDMVIPLLDGVPTDISELNAGEKRVYQYTMHTIVLLCARGVLAHAVLKMELTITAVVRAFQHHWQGMPGLLWVHNWLCALFTSLHTQRLTFPVQDWSHVSWANLLLLLQATKLYLLSTPTSDAANRSFRSAPAQEVPEEKGGVRVRFGDKIAFGVHRHTATGQLIDRDLIGKVIALLKSLTSHISDMNQTVEEKAVCSKLRSELAMYQDTDAFMVLVEQLYSAHGEDKVNAWVEAWDEAGDKQRKRLLAKLQAIASAPSAS